MRLLWVSLLVAGACSSTGTTKQATAPTRKLDAYRSVRVTVTADPEMEEAVPLVFAKLATRIRESGLFQRVISSSADPEVTDLVIHGRIVDLRKVSTQERVWVGGLAGRARVGLQVELTDARTAARIGSLVAEGKSSGGTGFAGRTAQAAEEVADQVVAYLRENR